MNNTTRVVKPLRWLLLKPLKNMVGQPSLEKVHNYQIYQKYIIFNKHFFIVSAKALNLEKVEELKEVCIIKKRYNLSQN